MLLRIHCAAVRAFTSGMQGSILPTVVNSAFVWQKSAFFGRNRYLCLIIKLCRSDGGGLMMCVISPCFSAHLSYLERKCSPVRVFVYRRELLYSRTLSAPRPHDQLFAVRISVCRLRSRGHSTSCESESHIARLYERSLSSSIPMGFQFREVDGKRY